MHYQKDLRKLLFSRELKNLGGPASLLRINFKLFLSFITTSTFIIFLKTSSGILHHSSFLRHWQYSVIELFRGPMGDLLHDVIPAFSHNYPHTAQDFRPLHGGGMWIRGCANVD